MKTSNLHYSMHSNSYLIISTFKYCMDLYVGRYCVWGLCSTISLYMMDVENKTLVQIQQRCSTLTY